MEVKIKMSLRGAIVAVIIGIVLIGVGAVKPEYIATRWAGVIVVCGGLVVVGRHAYTGIQEKAKGRKEERLNQYLVKNPPSPPPKQSRKSEGKG